jgi:hypothetical protein
MIAGMKKSAFFSKAPASVMAGATKTALLARAKLALWIAWAWDRDLSYWEKQTLTARGHGIMGVSEVWDWEPLRQELVNLGLSATSITLKGMNRMQLIYGLNMEAFIGWARSTAATKALFSGLATDPEGIATVNAKISSRTMSAAARVY